MSFIGKYRTMAGEAWAAYKYYQAAPVLFEAWVAKQFYHLFNSTRKFEDCELMAEGFCMGVKFTALGEMQFKQAWSDYEKKIAIQPIGI